MILVGICHLYLNLDDFRETNLYLDKFSMILTQY